MMTSFLLRLLKLIFGLFLYALGACLTIKAHIGYGPWDVFHAGVGLTVGISIGKASIAVGFIILILSWIAGETIGLGTVLNMFLIGFFMDVILDSGQIPTMTSFWPGIAMLVLGMYVVSVATYFYIGSRFGAGPRDSLMVALTRKSSLPIGLVRSMIEVTVTLIGWLLGGMVGIGTIIAGVLIGPCLQSVFYVLHFDPTKLPQSSLRENLEELRAAARFGKKSA